MVGKSVIVLFSGGIDSAACICYYLSQKFKVIPVYINYGQKSYLMEITSAKKIASFYNLDLKELIFVNGCSYEKGEIQARNAFFLISTALSFPGYTGIISLGIHSGTRYYDCSVSFITDMVRIFDGYFDGRVKIDAPFLNWSKKMIVDYSIDNNVPTHLTYSCENGTNPPCGNCLSCLDRVSLNVGSKVKN